jgi:F5/8 type C domain-containing protein/Big-like domain-containing protein
MQKDNMRRIAVLSAAGIVLSLFTIMPTAYNQASAAVCENLSVKGVTSNGDDGTNKAANTLDNNLSTRWSKQGKGSWITADLEEKKTICSVDIAWYKGYSRTYSFTISISGDGTSFTQVYSGKSSSDTLDPEKYNFADVEGRYVRITVNGNNNNSWAGITEIDIFGDSSSSSPPPSSMTINFANVAEGQTLSGSYKIVVSASDTSLVSNIKLYVDGVFFKTENYSPYEYTIDTTGYADGNHVLKAVATDTSGNTNAATITRNVIIQNDLGGSDPPTLDKKIMRPLWLPYADLQGQIDAYKDVLQDYDWPRLRLPHSADSVDSDHLTAFKSLNGNKLLSVTTLDKVKSHTSWAKSQGFAGVEYNIEGGFDAGDTGTQIREAASIVHGAGLKFVSTPTKAILADNWEAIADVADIVHIQAQTLQDDPSDFDSFVAEWVKKLKARNPNIIVTVQTGTGQPTADGMTLLETFQKCTDLVVTGSDSVDGVSVWWGSGEEELMDDYYSWYHQKYR